MRLRALGTSGVEVSAIGLGGYELGDGEALSIEHVREIVTASLDAGVNWFDTSEVYLDTRNETAIGEAILGFRDELIVASKVAPTPDGTGLRPEQIASACRASLKRLRTDRIDVYVVHWPDADDDVPLAETWGEMARLADGGHVHAIGLSNYEMADIEICHAIRPVDVIQQGLSLIDHEEERPVAARCGDLGIAAVIYEPLAGGVLTGALTTEAGHDQWAPAGTTLASTDACSRAIVSTRASRSSTGSGRSRIEWEPRSHRWPSRGSFASPASRQRYAGRRTWPTRSTMRLRYPSSSMTLISRSSMPPHSSPLRRWSRSASWNTVASTAFPWISQSELTLLEVCDVREQEESTLVTVNVVVLAATGLTHRFAVSIDRA